MWCQNWIQNATIHQVCETPVNPFAEYPETDQHDQRVAVVQHLSLDQPGIQQPKQTQGLRARPAHNIDLISLDEMFSPVPKHNNHEYLQSALVPARIQLFVETGTLPTHRQVRNTGMRNCHGTTSPITTRSQKPQLSGSQTKTQEDDANRPCSKNITRGSRRSLLFFNYCLHRSSQLP